MEWLRVIGFAFVIIIAFLILLFTQSCASRDYQNCRRICTYDSYNVPVNCRCADPRDEEIRREAEKLIR